MTELEIKNKLDPLLKDLSINKNLEAAEIIISELMKLIGIETSERKLLNIAKVDNEIHRFQSAPSFLKQAAAYEIPNNKSNLIDLKLYWLKKTTKTNLSWVVGLTPNFEDSPAHDFENIGIDFVVPEKADSLIILLSNRYKIRSLEIKDHITSTQAEIFKDWNTGELYREEEDFSIKTIFHNKLWESFNFEPINKKFYLELVESFSLLVNHLESDFGKKASVMFTTRLIGRLLFIWFLKKKNLINKDIKYFDVNQYKSQDAFYRNSLEVLFFNILNQEIASRNTEDKFTPYLNGGLFDTNITDFYNNPKLTFPNGFFNHLFETLNKYNFTVDESSPEFQHVAIDPEMLGRIFESLLAEQIDDSTGGNKKKSTGAFYTPREIVSYMCEESVIQFFKYKVPFSPERDRRIEELVRLPEAIFRDQDSNKRRDWKPYAESIIKALDGTSAEAPITILDPAVGSGAFPMGMLHLLVKIYSRADVKYEKNISQLKRNILSKSLYGVDIEQTAIEISRLRAWLSIIVDIEGESEVQPLPNLDFKFACANTLIPLTEVKQESLLNDPTLKDQLMLIRDKYFNTTKKIEKIKLQNEYIQLTHNEGLFDDNKTKQLKSYQPFQVDSSSSFYDPKLHHGIESFDIVIGNPPYIGEKGHKNLFQEIKSSELSKFYLRKMDLFYFFFHIGINYLKKDGILSFITTNYFITATGALKLRNDIYKRTKVLRLINFGELKIFESALGQHNMITMLTKSEQDCIAETIVTSRKGYLGPDILNSIINKKDLLTSYFKVNQSDLFRDGNIKLTIGGIDDLLDKIKKNSINLEDIADVNQGLRTGADKVTPKHIRECGSLSKVGTGIFILSKDELSNLNLTNYETEFIKPLFKNSDIEEFFSETETNNYLIDFFFPNHKDIDIDNIPNIINHLTTFKKILENRKENANGIDKQIKKGNFYFASVRRKLDFEQEKIVSPQRSKRNVFGYNNIPWYASADVYFITAPKNDNYSIKLLLGILNSKLIYVWLSSRGKKKGSMLELYYEPLCQIPIPLIDESNLDISNNIISLVDTLISLKKDNRKANIDSYLDRINALVFELYKLTDEEIELINAFNN